MMKCPNCGAKMTELTIQHCSKCGRSMKEKVAETFDMLAELVEKALKQELETRRRSRL